MSDFPRVTICPAMRCHQAVGARPRAFCGALARWFRPGNAIFRPAFFCDAHRTPVDLALPEELIFRRVRVQLAAIVGGVSPIASECQEEAAARLRSALEAAGAVVDVLGASSAWVSWARPAPPPSDDGEPGRP